MFGVGKHIPDIAQFHKPPGIHHRHFVHKLRHESHIMTNQDYSRADLFLHSVDGFHYLSLRNHIQSTGRLIGNNDFWPQQNADGDTNTLFHTAA